MHRPGPLFPPSNTTFQLCLATCQLANVPGGHGCSCSSTHPQCLRSGHTEQASRLPTTLSGAIATAPTKMLMLLDGMIHSCGTPWGRKDGCRSPTFHPHSGRFAALILRPNAVQPQRHSPLALARILLWRMSCCAYRSRSSLANHHHQPPVCGAHCPHCFDKARQDAVCSPRPSLQFERPANCFTGAHRWDASQPLPLAAQHPQPPTPLLGHPDDLTATMQCLGETLAGQQTLLFLLAVVIRGPTTCARETLQP